MPRKTKETEEITVANIQKTAKTKKANSNKNTNKTIVEKAEKKVASKRTPSTSKEKTSNTVKATKKQASKNSEKSTRTKSVAKKSTKATHVVTKKKANAKSAKKSDKASFVSVIEYYDLPYRYNQTIVKILAQTPQMLFVYWDISDDDRKTFEEHYGSDFFSKTKPVLIVHNETMNYSFEIEINDFANCWYLHVNDANCKYIIELGRRPHTYASTIAEKYIYISSSNEMDAPNNHILFEKFNPNVIYKNTKTGTTSSKDFSTISNYKNMQKIYNIYDLYKQIYKDELFNEIITTPTNPSSNFK